MTRVILSAALAAGLLATPFAGTASAGADVLRLLATVAHQQAEAAAEDAEAAKQQQKRKRPPRPIIDGIKGESTDDAHASQIDLQ